jgi:endonuclease G
MKRLINLCVLLLCSSLFAQTYIPKYVGEYKQQIVNEGAYTLCYLNDYELSVWVAYDLNPAQNVKRADCFRVDPKIVGGTATPKDYLNTGFDKGHLAPCDDFCDSTEHMQNTFFMSNMSPQYPNFNRIVWRMLEAKAKLIYAKYGNCYVVTGPVLNAPPDKYMRIGTSVKTVVPRFFYKIYFAKDSDSYHAWAFIIENMTSKQQVDDFSKYQGTVRNIEQLTGIDFFTELPQETQEKVETSIEKLNF